MKNGNHWKGKSRGSRKAYWRGVIESFSPERDRIETHCERLGMSITSFYRWRRKLGVSSAARRQRAAFIQLEVVAGSPTPRGAAAAWTEGLDTENRKPMHMEVVLAGRRSVRLADDFNAQAMSRLLSVLEA